MAASGLEALDEVSRDSETRGVLLRLAALERTGAMGSFVALVAADEELDGPTKDALRELASSGPFLLAAEDYLRAAAERPSG